MKSIALQDDEIHHSVGKVNFDPCPRESHTQFAPSGASSPIIPSSLISESPPIFISPPSKQRILEQCQLEQDRQRSGMLGLFHKVLGKLQSHASNTIVVNNYYYQGLAFQANNNYKEMMNYNPVFNIYNKGTIHDINLYGSREHREEHNEEQEETQDSDDDDHAATVNPLCDLSDAVINSSLFKYIVNKSKAPKILEWLHTNMDPIDPKYPKEKLKYLRALCEGGYFTKLIPRKDYIKEFGSISKSNYNSGMAKKFNYDRAEIDNIIDNLPF